VVALTTLLPFCSAETASRAAAGHHYLPITAEPEPHSLSQLTMQAYNNMGVPVTAAFGAAQAGTLGVGFR